MTTYAELTALVHRAQQRASQLPAVPSPGVMT
jgi:hypothetical protein